MELIIHIIIATLSIVIAGVNLAYPSLHKLRASYALIAATLASGTYLVILQPTHLASACFAGLTYLALVGVATGIARRKFAYQKIKKDS